MLGIMFEPGGRYPDNDSFKLFNITQQR